MSSLSAKAGRTSPLLPMLRRQVWSEMLRFFRIPAASAISFALPIVFYTFFGLSQVNNSCGQVRCGVYLLASFGAYSVTSLMVMSFGISVAVERGMRVNVLFRATPLPSYVLVLAKVISSAVFALAALLLLEAFAFLVGGVRIDLATWLRLTGVLLAGSLPFIAMGFAIGFVSGPNSAPAVANLIYLPMAFASGIFIPIKFLPDFIQRIAPFLPLNRYGQLAWASIGVTTDDPIATNLIWLAGFTILFLGLAMYGYRREEKDKFG